VELQMQCAAGQMCIQNNIKKKKMEYNMI